jgi:hypothetical protein
MEERCEHLDGSPIGKCAICGRTVCADCYRTVFNEMICDSHQALEEESAWELVGFYTDAATVADRRFLLEDSGIVTIAVESDEEATELYVPGEDKDDGYAVLQLSSEESRHCGDCRIQYSRDLSSCPLCGVRSPDDGSDEAHDPI